MAAIELFELYAMDNPFERDIFRTVYKIDFKHEICFQIIYWF